MKEFSFCNKPPYLTILLIKDIETLPLQFKFDHVTQVTMSKQTASSSILKEILPVIPEKNF